MKYIVITLLAFLISGCSGTPELVSPKGTVNNWALTGFEKADSINPILSPSADQLFTCPVSGKQVRWEERNVLNPTAVVKEGKVWLVYRAQDNEMTSRLGLAVSDDGLHFKKEPEPVFYFFCPWAVFAPAALFLCALRDERSHPGRLAPADRRLIRLQDR